MQKSICWLFNGQLKELRITKIMNGHWRPGFDLASKRIFMRIKLVTLLLTISMMHVFAAGNAQSITLSVKSMKLEQVFQAIKKQTGYSISVDQELLKAQQPLTFSVKAMPLDEFLHLIPLDHFVQGKTIFFIENTKPRPRPQPVPPVVPEVEVVPPLKGRITDSTGKALQGVSVRLVREGTYVGTASTDARGEFTITTETRPGDVLIVSYIGFFPQRVPVKDSRTIQQIVLKYQVNDLTGIDVTSVNTGYQKIRPEQSTGAVSKIATKEYESRVSTDFLSGLINKLPGLMINNNVQFRADVGDMQSSNSLFNVRGISTITGNQDPLIVVDGYPTELTLDMINPNEIESVTVLKDAAAATVYGVRASNGVIVIERKQAIAGKARFTFRSTTGMTPKENYTRYRWADDGAAINIAYAQERYRTSIDETSWGRLRQPRAPAYDLPYYIMAQQAADIITPHQADMHYQELLGYDNASEYSRLFLRNETIQTYNLNVSGGNPGALYYITANYRGDRFTRLNSSAGQFQLTGRTTLSLSKRLSLELNTDYLEDRRRQSPVPAINTLYPYERLQDENGAPLPVYTNSGINPFYNTDLMRQGFQDHLYYPLIDVNEVNDQNKTVNNRITANFKYKLSNGFNLAFGGIYESARTDMRHYASERSSEAKQFVNKYTLPNATGGLTHYIPQGGYLRHRTSNTTSYTVRGQLNYDRRIGKDHSVNGILGAEVRSVVDQLSSAAYFGYNDQTLLQQPVNYAAISAGFSNPLISASNLNYADLFTQEFSDNRYVSGFTNIVYSFRNKYSLSGSARLEQSNLFGTNPKYRYKPLWSAGLAWNIHQEPFMQSLPWVKQLKLRVAEGINGNVAKMSLPRVIAKASTNLFTAPVQPALNRFSFANSTLRWEQTNNFNAGLDFSIFKSITGSFDFYNKRSTALLSRAQINPSIGSSAIINTASINNSGLELNLQADWITRHRFNWNTGLVVSRNTSKVLKVFQQLAFHPTTINRAGYVEGYPLGALFAYRWAGLSDQGYPLVKDQEGKLYNTSDNTIGTSMTNRSAGLFDYVGTTVPAMNAGLSNRIDVGNFYFYCMINYYGDFKVQVPRATPVDLRPLETAGDYWRQPGDEQVTDVMSLRAFSTFYANYAYNNADKNVVNGDYLTLADVTASYNFGNSPMFKKAGFTQFELKLQASNVYTIGLNKYNYSMETRSYEKSYVTPTYTIALFTNF